MGRLLAEGHEPVRMKAAWIADDTIADLSVTTIRHRPNASAITAGPAIPAHGADEGGSRVNRRHVHPTWCGQGHVCSADRPAAEHRSHPLTLDTATARIVATRIRTVTGRDRLEAWAVVDLPADPHTARDAAWLVLLRVHQAITARVAGGGR